MRIAVFHPSFKTLGGAEVLALAQATALRERGDEISVLTFDHDPSWWAEHLDGISVQVIPKRDWLDPFTFWHPTSKYQRRGRKAERLLAAQKPDLVLAHNHPSPAMLGWANLDARKVWYCHEPPRGLHPAKVNRKVIAEIQAGRATQPFLEAAKDWGAAGFQGWHDATRRLYDRGGVGRMHQIFANSAYTRESIQLVYGPRPVDVVYPMVQEPSGLNPRQGLRAGGLHILVQARLETLKNIETVLMGFDHFFRKDGKSAHLHVVGDGNNRSNLQALAARLASAKAISFHGFLGEAALAELRDRCDVFTLLPLDEPFGLVFPEAALRGLLLVGPDHGGPMEILEGGELGWANPPFDPEALADTYATIQALPDPEVDHYRIKAAQSCRARFSPQVIAPRLHDLLHASFR